MGRRPDLFKDHLIYVDIEGHALISLDPKSKLKKFGKWVDIGTVVPVRQMVLFVPEIQVGLFF